MWEEVKIPISYQTDRKLAENILLDCAHEVNDEVVERARAAAEAFQKRYFIDIGELDPRVFIRITDNWIEMNLRMIVPIHGIRYYVDELARLIMERFDHAGIGIASGTYAIVEFPKVKVELEQPREQAHPRPGA